MSVNETKSELSRIERSSTFVDIFAELSTITGYDTPAGSFVNISFINSHVIPLVNDLSFPESSEIEFHQVAAVTMLRSRAEALHLALGKALESAPKGE
ncbi:hypothetical protein ACJQ64_003573 [Yersinia enterocolitica]|uniref:hypothetical protein n=1 Tax=Yersinia intermedia TaxID=631 RepID=UPI000B410D0B|nr:hypothetical protein [Yersinia intermedia]ELI7902393.1 hypothetical protein [Yersinia enterocolitica]ELI8005616.1 hypothetical protein [Yersinia enterocolitica]ELX2217368.1 hypothetical protein [Yersinia enterocolitica]OVZ72853.1 hypothetical protein CBW55_23180 [Yersinia intermedia]